MIRQASLPAASGLVKLTKFEQLFLKISSPRASLIRSGTQTSLVIKCAQSIWREREVKTNFAEERLKTEKEVSIYHPFTITSP